jgi:hypothetical protein
MKPQSLQDAIKAAALKNQTNRQKTGWKEPVVKQHKITAEDLKAAASPKAALLAPAAYAAPPPQQFSQELQREKAAWAAQRDALLTEMKTLRELVTSQTSQLESFRRDLKTVSSLAETVSSQGKELMALRQDLSAAAMTSQGTSSRSSSRALSPPPPTATAVSPPKSPKTPSRTLMSMLSPKRNSNVAAVASESSNMTTTTTTSKQSSPSPTTAAANLYPSTTPKTPTTPRSKKKAAAALPNLKPHSAATMAEAQRRDKELKEFIKNKTGGLPYTYKSMSIQEYQAVDPGADNDDPTKHIVLFDHRCYVPAKLRAATLAYYVQHNPYDAATALQQHCIWPNCVEDLHEFRTTGKQASSGSK